MRRDVLTVIGIIVGSLALAAVLAYTSGRPAVRKAADLTKRACEKADEASRLADRVDKIWKADR